MQAARSDRYSSMPSSGWADVAGPLMSPCAMTSQAADFLAGAFSEPYFGRAD